MKKTTVKHKNREGPTLGYFKMATIAIAGQRYFEQVFENKAVAILSICSYVVQSLLKSTTANTGGAYKSPCSINVKIK